MGLLIFRRRKPAPVTVRTHIEHDLAELDVTPAMIEPNAYCMSVALDNAGMFMAYMRVGFHRDEAFELLSIQLDAALNRRQG